MLGSDIRGFPGWAGSNAHQVPAGVTIVLNEVIKLRKERDMEESTQMVDLPGEEGSSPILSPPMGYLRVFAQKAIEERNYPVAEGVCVHESLSSLIYERKLHTC